MSLCILEGHHVVKKAGIGHYSGQDFDICGRCGVTLDSDGRAMTKEQVEANRAISQAFHRATHP